MRYLVQAGVELQDLQGAHIPHHEPVLHTGSLSSKLREKKRKCDLKKNNLTLLTLVIAFI